jgi:membrane associated rhomboid family serine protease
MRRQGPVLLPFVIWIAAGLAVGLVAGEWALAAVLVVLPCTGGLLGLWVYRRWMDPNNLKK